MNFNISFSPNFYIDNNLFATCDADIKAAFNDPSRIGTLNGVQVAPIDHNVLVGLTNDMGQHFKQTFRYGFLAVTAIVVAGIASAILGTPAGSIVAGSIGLIMYTVCIVKMYLEKKKFNSVRERFTQQRMLAAQNYLANGPIEVIRQKDSLYNLHNGNSPTLQALSEELDLVNPGTFNNTNLLPIQLTSKPLDLFLRCFIFQQMEFDGIKDGTNRNTSVAQLQYFVINWYKGIDTPHGLAYCNLVIQDPLTEKRFDDEPVKACVRKYFFA